MEQDKGALLTWYSLVVNRLDGWWWLVVLCALCLVACDDQSVMGCDDEIDECNISPSSIDFGYVLTPPFSGFSVTYYDTVVVANRGEKRLDVVVTFHIEMGSAPYPLFFVASGVDSSFSVPPGSEESLVLAAVVTDENSGEYAGVLELGAFCGTAPFRMVVLQRQ